MYKNTENKIALSFDVEDWFTVRNMRGVFQFKEWGNLETRLRIGLDFILDNLSEKQIKATFFILGWHAERYPEIVKDISSLGHEVASHGYSHTPIDLMTPESFRDDLVRSMDVIGNISGDNVTGFRAPSFSITRKTAWAIDVLRHSGIVYDSSIFSTYHPDYGIHDFPTQVTNIDGLIEVPMRKGKFFGASVPVCGGGYFRMFPYSMIKSTLKQTLNDGPLVMYFHPWEFDPDQPKVGLSGLKKFRHYVGLSENRKKFQMLLGDFQFECIGELIEEEKQKDHLEQISLSQFFQPNSFSPRVLQ